MGLGDDFDARLLRVLIFGMAHGSGNCVFILGDFIISHVRGDSADGGGVVGALFLLSLDTVFGHRISGGLAILDFVVLQAVVTARHVVVIWLDYPALYQTGRNWVLVGHRLLPVLLYPALAGSGYVPV